MYNSKYFFETTENKIYKQLSVMKILLLILFVSCGLATKNEYKNLSSLLENKNHNRVRVKELPKEIVPWYIEGVESDTSTYLLHSYPNIRLIKIDHGKDAQSIIKINDKEFLGKIENNKITTDLDMDFYHASVYKLQLNNKKFICIVSLGTGLLQCGSFQQIAFFVLVDITHPKDEKVYFLHSYDNSIFAFDDIDNDGNLDFLRFRLIARDGNEYEYAFETTSLHDGKFDDFRNIGRVKRIGSVCYLFENE